ncbi:hypothetical protein N9261_00640, partial [bacterium]|nr:hypothetical protein [bacterium]
ARCSKSTAQVGEEPPVHEALEAVHEDRHRAARLVAASPRGPRVLDPNSDPSAWLIRIGEEGPLLVEPLRLAGC